MDEEEFINDLRLSSVEKDSALWKKIRKAINGKISDLRERNDNMMTESMTTHIRGQIAFAKYVLEFESVEEEETE
ncbi:MAG: hypothetical protein H6937_09520 [Burkholderiales bacterium]|nr:hypothetical protein [Burkholderiales bacterium]